MKIGIYGGSFNPIHKTHMKIARAAYEQYELDKVIFLIAGYPPQKSNDLGILNKHRVKMVSIACDVLNAGTNDKIFEFDTRELERTGKSYTYLSIEEYKKEFLDDQLFFIMGSDSLMYFDEWMNPEIICKNASILVARRKGQENIDIVNKSLEVSEKFNSKINFVETEADSVASSTIRDLVEDLYSPEKIKKADLADFISNYSYKCIEYSSKTDCNLVESYANKIAMLETLIDERVLQYIIQHLIYSEKISSEFVNELILLMQKELKPGRYRHSLGVATTAYNLAIRYDIDPSVAFTAGILHDCAKCISDDKRIDVCKKNNISIRSIELNNPSLLHSKVGAFYAHDKYDINNIYILHSIMTHTVGCENMNLLDKIIYISDYIEPGRDRAPRLNEIRTLAYEDLNKCMAYISNDTINYLTENIKSIDELSFKTCEYYKRYI